MHKLKVVTLRLAPDFLNEIEAIAELGGVTSTDVMRLALKRGLPVVRHGFEEMNLFLEHKSLMKKAGK